MNYVYCVKVKKSTLRSNEPISETRARRELSRLEQRQESCNNALSSIHKTLESATDFAKKLNNQLCFKRWTINVVHEEGFCKDFFLEVRFFYVVQEPIYG